MVVAAVKRKIHANPGTKACTNHQDFGAIEQPGQHAVRLRESKTSLGFWGSQENCPRSYVGTHLRQSFHKRHIDVGMSSVAPQRDLNHRLRSQHRGAVIQDNQPARVQHLSLFAIERFDQQNRSALVFVCFCAVQFGGFEDSLSIEMSRHQEEVFGESSIPGRGGYFDHLINNPLVVDSRKSLPVVQVEPVIVRGQQ